VAASAPEQPCCGSSCERARKHDIYEGQYNCSRPGFPTEDEKESNKKAEKNDATEYFDPRLLRAAKEPVQYDEKRCQCQQRMHHVDHWFIFLGSTTA
jgi:hypothetical protein